MRGFTLCVFAATLVLATTAVRAEDDIGLTVAEGFTVTKYADDTLAHDIFSLTVDTAGRVVVSGPGYVKILIDADRDGKAEKAIQFTDGPKIGAQGMVFLGRDLLLSGDEGLVLYKDEDKDDKADGPPELFLKVRTGGEHNAHAIRRGPDGWWYLITGNSAMIDENYVTVPTSPVKFPHGGLVLRMKPDLSGAEVFADCFRNAYDFDFNAQGELFVYDSDGERDVSLPWYRPSRLFHALRGGEHGWITDQWKRPDVYFDSAPVAAQTGRGSPTGVVCYRHTQFPAAYRNGMFLLDWTFGRVFFAPLNREGSTWAGEPKVFLQTSGQQGFAPTDCDVGIDGSLYICAGGRGTQGTVYRIAYTGADQTDSIPAVIRVKETDPPAEQLTAVLNAPMPHSAWSRARWITLARKGGGPAFQQAVLNEKLTPEARVRAIEILTELFGGLPPTTLASAAKSSSPEVRARAAWSVGVTKANGVAAAGLRPYLTDLDPLVKRSAVEALSASELAIDPIVPALAEAMNDADRLVRLQAARLIPDMETNAFKALSEATRQLGWRAAATNGLGFVWRQSAKSDGFNAYGLELGRRMIDGSHPQELKLLAVRILQCSLADVGPDNISPAAFDSFASPIGLKKYKPQLEPIGEMLLKHFPTKDVTLDEELSRLAAMMKFDHPDFAPRVLAKLTDESDPVEDLHYLAVLARTMTKPSPEFRNRLAHSVIRLDQKLAERKISVDTNWKDRVTELYEGLVQRDGELPLALLDQPGFGRPPHVMFLGKLPEQHLPKAIALFTAAAKADPEYAWTSDVIFVLGFDKSPEHFEMIRQQFERFDVRMSVLMVLAGRPHEVDRLLFAEGLDSGPIEVVRTCLAALKRLPGKEDSEELAWLVKLLRRLGDDPGEHLVREEVVALLERNAGVKFPFITGEEGHKPQPETADAWTAWLNEKHRSAADKVLGGATVSIPELKDRLAKIDWKTGDSQRGHKLFTAKGCAVCHSGGGNLGPDLAGAAGRFSRDDLFLAIADPNRDVSPRYQTLQIETRDGKQYSGMIVYENVDGVVIRNGANQTFRFDPGQIESRKPVPTSLMPTGLMNGMSDQDLADVYRYLQSLGVQTAEAETPATQ